MFTVLKPRACRLAKYVGQFEATNTFTMWCAESPTISHGAPVASTKYLPFALVVIGNLLLVVEVTVKVTPLLATPPTVTTTFPVVAPTGTAATMLVALQLVGVAPVPLKLTVLVPGDTPKFAPVIVTEVPAGPEVGVRLAMLGAEAETEVTVNPIPLLATPPTVTTTFPVVAPAGTATTMLVALQLVGIAAAPLKLTVLLPCNAPKFVPVIVTDVPATPEAEFRLAIFGTKAVEPAWPPLEQPVFSSEKFKANNNRTTLARRGSEFPFEFRNRIVSNSSLNQRMQLDKPKNTRLTANCPDGLILLKAA